VESKVQSTFNYPRVDYLDWEVHMRILLLFVKFTENQILANNQPDAFFYVFIYSFHLSTCFEHQVFIIRRLNCIKTTTGTISLCSDCLVCQSGGNCSSLLTGIPSSHLHRLIIPDNALKQLDLLMMSN